MNTIKKADAQKFWDELETAIDVSCFNARTVLMDRYLTEVGLTRKDLDGYSDEKFNKIKKMIKKAK